MAGSGMGVQDDLFTQAPPCSYAGITIPVHSFQIYSGSQVAWHKYPYRPGADAEFTGREQTTGQIVAPFFVGMVAEQSANALWPGAVSLLRSACQTQMSQKLVLPAGLGTLAKAVIKVNESYTAEARDGAMVTIQFWEDNSEALASLPTASALSQLPNVSSQLDAVIGTSIFIPPLFTDQNGNIISAFRTAVDTILSNLQVFQTDLSLPLSQISQMLGSITDLLQTSNALRSPSNWQTYQYLLQVADGLSSAAQQIVNTQTIAIYTTKVDTNIVAIASATSCGPADLMKLNNVPDWNYVPQGSFVNYYKTSVLGSS